MNIGISQELLYPSRATLQNLAKRSVLFGCGTSLVHGYAHCIVMESEMVQLRSSDFPSLYPASIGHEF